MRFARIAAFIMLIAPAFAAGPARSQAAKPAINSKAPAISLEDLQGQNRRLSDYAGKNVVIVQFWATWCPHCRAALQAMNDLHRDYQENGIAILGVIQVTSRDPEDQIRKFAAGNKLPYDVILLDRDGAAAATYGSRGVPDTMVIDGSGVLRARMAGSVFPGGAEIRRAIEVSLAQLPGSTFKARSLEELNKAFPPPQPTLPAAAPPVPAAGSVLPLEKMPAAEQAYVHLQLGIAYLNIGDRLKGAGLGDGGYHKRAADELQQAGKLAPSDVDVLYWMGMAYERTGDFARAAECYRKALNQAGDRRAADSLRRLGAPK